MTTSESQDTPGAHPCWTAQHIGLAWVAPASATGSEADLRFRIVEQFKHGESIDFRLQHLTRPYGPALRFVDACGDTVFNEFQVAALVEELSEIRSRVEDADLIAHIDALLAFASRSVQPHAFLWFIGD